MKLFYALFASEVLARRERAQPYRQIITDPDKLYFAPVRRQITDVESMNKDEFKIYNNKAVQELRFKDPRQLTLDEAEDIADFYANLRKWQARMDDDEERELWRTEKIHQKKVQYQNIEHQYDKEKGRERRKKHGEPKTWTLDDEAERKKKLGKGKKKGKDDKVEKGNKKNATRDDYIEMRERMEREEFERMRKFEDPSFEGYDDYEEEIIMDDDEDNDTAEDRKRRDADKEKVSTGADDIGKKMRGRRDARMFEMPLPQEDDVEYIDEDDEDDDEPRYKHYREDGLPHPREYFGKHEEEEEEIHYSEDQLYRDNLRVQEITAQLFQTQGDMEFDAVWDRVKMHIPESFAKGKDDWKLKAIFQQQAQNMRDDENLRMRAAEIIQKQRAEKEHYQRFARKMMDKYEGDL